MKKLSFTSLAFALSATASIALANTTAPTTTVIHECPGFFEPATVELTLQLSHVLDCPMLEDRSTRRLVNRFAVGSEYAYPAVPGTCLVGSNVTGQVTLLNSGHRILVEGSTASAQRLFPEAKAIDNGLFVSGMNLAGPFGSGATTSVVTLVGTSEFFFVQIVTEDRFTIDYSAYPAKDTEEFTILGSRGVRNVIGRLVGTADIHTGPNEPVANETVNITGNVCMR